MEILRAVTAEPGLVVLHGEGGVGKSALAANLCRELVDPPWGDQIGWADFDQYPEHRDSHRVLLQVLRHVSESLISDPVEADELLHDATLDFLEQHRGLVVLDNVERFHLSPQLRSWLDDASHCGHILITTRGLPVLPRGRHIHLTELAPADSQALFVSLWHAAITADEAGEEARRVAAQICDEVGHLPLAVELVASRRLPLGVLLENVRGEITDIAASNWAGPARQQSISACFRLSYDQLSAQATSLFLHTSVLPGGASTEVLNAITEGGRWAESAEQLVDAALWRLQTDRYVTHPLVRRFALQELGPDRAGIEVKVAAVLVAWLEQQGQLTEPSVPHGQRVEALDAIEAEWRNVVWAVDLGARARDAQLLSQIASSLRDFCWQRSHWEDCEPIYRQVLEAHRTGAEPKVLAQTLECLGLLYQRAGDWQAALEFFQDALNSLAADPSGLTTEEKLIHCRAKYGLGLAWSVLGQPDRAKAPLLEAVGLAEEIRSPTAEAIAHSNLGVLYISERNWAAAHSSLKRSLSIRSALGDRSGEGDIHLRLATVAHVSGNFSEACGACQRAVELFRDTDNRLDEMIALVRKAEALRELGQWADALAASEEALQEFRQQGHHSYYEAMALNQIAMTYLTQGDAECALSTSDASVAASSAVGDAIGEAFGRYVRGAALLELGGDRDARSELEESQQLFASQQDTIMAARVSVSLAVLLSTKEPAAATTIAEKALEDLKACGDVIGEALAYEAAGDAQLSLGTGDPLPCYEQAASLFRQKRIPFRIARCQLKMARAQVAARDYQAAQRSCDAADQALHAADDDWARIRLHRLADELRPHNSSSGSAARNGESRAALGDLVQSSVSDLLLHRESSHLEFKRHGLVGHDGHVSQKTKDAIIKAVAGFLNSEEGGVLLIGVDDASGRPIGLNADYAGTGRGDRDGFENQLMSMLRGALGDATMVEVPVEFETIDDLDVCRLDIRPSDEPVHLKDGSLFVRIANATVPLRGSDATKFVRRRWPRSAE
jgi:tetratricopeptide (TPR) repeat protein